MPCSVLHQHSVKHTSGQVQAHPQQAGRLQQRPLLRLLQHEQLPVQLLPLLPLAGAWPLHSQPAQAACRLTATLRCRPATCAACPQRNMTALCRRSANQFVQDTEPTSTASMKHCWSTLGRMSKQLNTVQEPAARPATSGRQVKLSASPRCCAAFTAASHQAFILWCA